MASGAARGAGGDRAARGALPVTPTPCRHVDVHPGSRWPYPSRPLRYHLPTLPADRAEAPRGESPDVRWFDWPRGHPHRRTGARKGCCGPPARHADPPAGRGWPTHPGVRTSTGVRKRPSRSPEVPEPHTEPEIATWMAARRHPDHGCLGRRRRRCRRRADDARPPRYGWLHHLVHRSMHGCDSGLGDRFMTLARRTTTRAVIELWAFQSNLRASTGLTSVTASSRSSSPTVPANEESWPDVRYARGAYVQAPLQWNVGWNPRVFHDGHHVPRRQARRRRDRHRLTCPQRAVRRSARTTAPKVQTSAEQLGYHRPRKSAAEQAKRRSPRRRRRALLRREIDLLRVSAASSCALPCTAARSCSTTSSHRLRRRAKLVELPRSRFSMASS